MYVCIYIYIYICIYQAERWEFGVRDVRIRDAQLLLNGHLHSAKGGAVETGCSGFHFIIGCFII